MPKVTKNEKRKNGLTKTFEKNYNDKIKCKSLTKWTGLYIEERWNITSGTRSPIFPFAKVVIVTK
jgi:hypothetical protein